MEEHELKIPVANLGELRLRLEEAGATLRRPARREQNVLFDFPDERLKMSDRALRLRRVAGTVTLTYKGPSSYTGRVKGREELEIEVADDAHLEAILDRLDLCPLVRYEKDRELWQMGVVEVALDHTPMGDFVELEGPPESLTGVAVSLGLDVDRAVLDSYLALWQRHREQHRSSNLPRDMVFEG
jgi:adenylate cyclase class 2